MFNIERFFLEKVVNKNSEADYHLKLIFVAYTALILIAVLDYWTGFGLDLAVLYLVPIMFLALALGHRAGIVISLVAVLFEALADLFSIRSIPSHVTLWWNTFTSLLIYLAFVYLVSTMKNLLEKESVFARIDYLTGLNNRKAFYDAVTQEIARSRRHGRVFSLAYIDCDNFKQVNDEYGHAIGDQVLQTLAQTMLEKLRNTDIVARLGGDEFVLLIPETDPNDSLMVVQRLFESLNETMRKCGWPVTFSIGLASFRRVPDNIEAMLHEADSLMYAAKNEGKNRIIHKIFD
ncbi:MAG: GGDEF domain-containing protein [Candidatus Saccharibacteria bacterium]